MNITELITNSRGHGDRWQSELAAYPLTAEEREYARCYFDRKNITKIRATYSVGFIRNTRKSDSAAAKPQNGGLRGSLFILGGKNYDQ